MSDKDFEFYDDDVLKNLEKLKSKYSDYGVDDEAIEKINQNIVRSNPDYNAFADDFAGGFSDFEKDEASEDKEPEIQPTPQEEPIQADEDEPVFEELISNESTEAIEKSDNKPMPVYDEPENDKIIEEKPVKSKKKKKKKSHKVRNALLIIFIIAVIWSTFFAIDYIRVYNWQSPIFCIKTDEYKNGSEDYLGAFYKLQYNIDAEGNENWLVLPWFQEGPNTYLEKKNDKKSSVSDAKEANASASTDNTIVEITVSTDLIEEDTTDGIELTVTQKQNGYKSATLNQEDGTVTYTLTKSDYDKEVARLKEETENKLLAIADSTDYPSIKKVEFSDNFQTVTLYVDAEAYQSGLDRFINASISQWVGFYQTFAKTDFACELVVKDILNNSTIS